MENIGACVHAESVQMRRTVSTLFFFVLPWLQAPGCYDGIPTDAISAKLSSTLWVREHSLILVWGVFCSRYTVVMKRLWGGAGFFVFIPANVNHCYVIPQFPSTQTTPMYNKSPEQPCLMHSRLFNSLQIDPTFVFLLNTSIARPCHNLWTPPPPPPPPPSCPHCSLPAVASAQSASVTANLLRRWSLHFL